MVSRGVVCSFQSSTLIVPVLCLSFGESFCALARTLLSGPVCEEGCKHIIKTVTSRQENGIYLIDIILV